MTILPLQGNYKKQHFGERGRRKLTEYSYVFKRNLSRAILDFSSPNWNERGSEEGLGPYGGDDVA
jgi:hypothetical protein